ncbi:site-specific integrase [Pseudomonas viridiflava]|uniref:site-specific integrase n=1 Tax=Pseudomonas viridiflava TaxID=33069 RepID=UPI000F01FC47|nr:site-specific integrase [Pseudomonas viridiflava]
MLDLEYKVMPLLGLAHFKSVTDRLAQEVEEQSVRQELAGDALAFYNYLKGYSVTKVSHFLDPVWDWNLDNRNAAKTMRGSKLLINFERFPNVPAGVLIELKVIIQCYALAPNALVIADTNSKAKRIPKAATVVSLFNEGLAFLDTLFSVMSEAFGDEFVLAEINSLQLVPVHCYDIAAKKYPRIYSERIRQFFDIVWSPFFRGAVFAGALANVVAANLPWASVTAKQKDNLPKPPKEKILSNNAFQHASMMGSLVIVDFLESMNIPVIDANSLARRNEQGYRESERNNINPDTFALYTYKRLSIAGHPMEDIKRAIGRDDQFTGEMLSCCPVTAFKRFKEVHGYVPDEAFWFYLNFVSYACMYMIAQYTGMRVSELADLISSECLKPDGSRWLIRSNVHKHREESVLLFDDYWVAIPIVRDAVQACILISQIKANPYVFSNAFTVPFGKEPEALSGVSYKSTIGAFLKKALSDNEYNGLNFYPYMLRHTLAYQLYRADVGLPFISHQLKHFSGIVGSFGVTKGFSKTTLAYGEIGDMLASTSKHDSSRVLRHAAELELVKNIYDPGKGFAGKNAAHHVANLQKTFDGYLAAGYTEAEIYEAIAEQRIAVVSVGQAFCYGNRAEEFDPSIPCLGGLRCNPNRCSSAVITEGNAPAWQGVFEQNKRILASPEMSHLHEASQAAMTEAREVLLLLGHEV